MTQVAKFDVIFSHIFETCAPATTPHICALLCFLTPYSMILIQVSCEIPPTYCNHLHMVDRFLPRRKLADIVRLKLLSDLPVPGEVAENLVPQWSR